MRGFKLLEFTRKGTKKVWSPKTLNVQSRDKFILPTFSVLFFRERGIIFNLGIRNNIVPPLRFRV